MKENEERKSFGILMSAVWLIAATAFAVRWNLNAYLLPTSPIQPNSTTGQVVQWAYKGSVHFIRSAEMALLTLTIGLVAVFVAAAFILSIVYWLRYREYPKYPGWFGPLIAAILFGAVMLGFLAPDYLGALR